ncbi:hypothetical protein BH24CHL6_BH24CHL6_05510 [soil metagenome]
MSDFPAAAAIVLAAGLGERFGGDKLVAELDGRPLLQHVLDTAAGAALEPVVVVMAPAGQRLEAAISWRNEIQVVNKDPARGLSSSLQAGLLALQEAAPETGRVLVLLGDQPRLAGAQVGVLLSQAADPGRPISVPRYEDGRPGNPVLLERAAWSLAAELRGDRGMAQLFVERPELVRYVDLPGLNPDVDKPADLDGLR